MSRQLINFVTAAFVIAASSMGFATSASASVITFEANDGLNTSSNGFSFDDSGFHFVFGNISNGFAQVNNPPNCTPACTFNGTNAYYSFNRASLTMSALGGTPFSLLSVDAAQTFTTFNRKLDLTIIGQVVGGGTVSTTLTTAAGAADIFGTFALPAVFGNLLSVQFVGGVNYPDSEFAIDNIVAGDAVTVPEPGTLAMIVAGIMSLFGFGMMRRRAET